VRLSGRIITPLLVGMFALVVGIQVSGCSSSKASFSDLAGEGSEIRVYEVFGMDCPGCHGGLENLVNEIPGVRASQANWEQQLLRVALDPAVEVDDDTIHNAIKRANFTSGRRRE
jgi:copper chaperone CopZ